MPGFVYEKEYEVHYYEIDFKGKALITSIVDFLGDIATKQSEELGVGIEFLKEKGLAWVLYKWNIDMYKYPNYGDKIIIKTQPCAMKKFYAYRKFEILTTEGEVLGKAESVWFLINIQKRRPMRVTEDLYDYYGVDINDDSILEIEDIEKMQSVSVEKAFDVRYSDIDTNRHVNNVKYIAWSIETVPLETVLNYTLTNIKVTYEKETTYGETIKVLTEMINEEDKIICLHKIVDKDEKQLTLLKTVWEKK